MEPKGKRKRPDVAATSDQQTGRRPSVYTPNRGTNRCLFIHDPKTKRKYLIDRGSDVSALPNNNKRLKPESKLFAANGAPINTYREKMVSLELGLYRDFKFPFLTADVNHGIIGADFLNEFNLLVDIRNKKLIDATTQLCSNCFINITEQSPVSLVDSTSELATIIRDFPGLTQPTARHKGKFPHGVAHTIETTGRPVHFKARRLPPDKLKVAKEVFREWLTLGGIVPSVLQV